MTHFRVRRIVKITLISVGSVLAAALLAVGIALAVVLSPKRFTPLVNHFANQNLQAEVQVREVDLTFFSTFPHIGLVLKDGLVVSHAFRDSAFTPEDTLFTVNILLPSLTAALRLHGDSLVLLDGETFTRISKVLMFKNKKRNLIDSISAVIAVQDGKITVYPFVIELDKYRVAVGGWQDMNMNYRYHISLLDAPVLKGLTRGGITMNGNFNDPKLPWPKLGHPLYKDAGTPAFVRQVDEARLDLGRQIMLQFEGWMNRERRRVREVNFPKMEIVSDSTAQ